MSVQANYTSPCIIWLVSQHTTWPIQVTFNGSLIKQTSELPCSPSLHIGNDINRVNQESLTSYRFCNGSSPVSIVSREHMMWIAIEGESTSDIPWQQITYTALPRVTCNESEFACSEVECVPLYQVCDGTADCTNHQDEYCVNTSVDTSWSSCFRCASGQCVWPRQLVYQLDRGRHWWFLCDGQRHCQDGTDERYDVCLRHRSRVKALHTCNHGNGTHSGGGGTVFVWTRFLCDGHADCPDGDDETHEQCRPAVYVPLVEPHVIYLPAMSLLLFIGLMILLSRYDKYRERQQRARRRRRHRPYTITQGPGSGTEETVAGGGQKQTLSRVALIPKTSL